MRNQKIINLNLERNKVGTHMLRKGAREGAVIRNQAMSQQGDNLVPVSHRVGAEVGLRLDINRSVRSVGSKLFNCHDLLSVWP